MTAPSLIHKKPDGTEKTLELGPKPIVIGRLPESDVSVRDSFISRVHCGILLANDQYTLKDLGSTNGTYRNGARVYECTLASGDKIQVGNTTLLFEIDGTAGQVILRQVASQAVPPRAPAAGPGLHPPSVFQPKPVSAPPRLGLK